MSTHTYKKFQEYSVWNTEYYVNTKNFPENMYKRYNWKQKKKTNFSWFKNWVILVLYDTWHHTGVEAFYGVERCCPIKNSRYHNLPIPSQRTSTLSAHFAQAHRFQLTSLSTALTFHGNELFSEHLGNKERLYLKVVNLTLMTGSKMVHATTIPIRERTYLDWK